MHSPKPQRILMTADTIGGVWTYALELARALGPMEIALATMGAPVSDEQRAELSCLPNVKLFESCFRLEWMDDPWDDVEHAGEWLLEIAEDFEPDVIHLNGYAHGALPWSAPTLIVAHSCVLSWWEAVKSEPAPARYDEYQRRVSLGLRGADFVVAPTAAMLDSLVENYGLLPSREVIPNGRDASKFQPGEKRPAILTVGRIWDEAKNVSALSAIAHDVRWSIYVAGEPEHPNGSQRSLNALKPLGQLPGPVLAQHFASAAIYVSPARYEPFGLAALEAGLSGCALVLGDIATLREVWGNAAVFVPPDDHDALRDAVNHLIADDDLRQSYASRARERALHFTATRMAEQYLNLYRRMLSHDEIRTEKLEVSRG